MSGPKIICEYDALLSKAAVRIFAKFEAAFTNFALLDAKVLAVRPNYHVSSGA